MKPFEHHRICRGRCRAGGQEVAAIIVLVLLAGCTVGPDYKAPALPDAPGFDRPLAASASANEAALAAWWHGFGDAELSRLTALAIERNHDLRVATARLREARALRGLARADLFPTVEAAGGYANSLASKDASPPGATRDDRESEFYDAGFDASWEVDLFGRVRRSVQVANASLEAVEADRLLVQVIVTSEVGREYFELRGLQARLDVARRNEAVQAETLKITEARAEGGRGNEFDVARSRSLLNLTRSTIPPLEAAVGRSIRRLAVLTGVQPGAVASGLAVASAIPVGEPRVAMLDPGEVLRRRPDVRAAERALAAETARIGMAKADLFPRFILTGAAGFGSASASGLGDPGSDTWSIAPRVKWAAFDLGRVRSRIQAADARTEAALARYEQVVLLALEETQNALEDRARESERLAYLEASAEASRRAAELAHVRFDAGAADFLSILDSERTLLEAEDRLAVSRTRAGTALVAVFKAFGGGIEPEWTVAAGMR